VGTEQDVVNGQMSYYAWYELLPNFAIRLNNVVVAPGNTMIASLNLVNSGKNIWSVKISDVTTGQYFSKNVVYNSTLSSGEWIMERPTINGQVSTLADFGKLTFTDCHVTVNNVSGSISKFAFFKIQMSNSVSAELASSSDVIHSGTDFTVSYIAGK
jgi:hypothetical protein